MSNYYKKKFEHFMLKEQIIKRKTLVISFDVDFKVQYLVYFNNFVR